MFDLQKLSIPLLFLTLHNTTHALSILTTADFIRSFRVSHVPIPGAMDLHFVMSLLSSTLYFPFFFLSLHPLNRPVRL